MSNIVTLNTKSTATSKAELLTHHVWNRFATDASTAFPQDEDDDWVRAESDGSEDLNPPCQTTAGSKDWRPLTCTLRQELEHELHSRKGLHQESVSSDVITSTSKDWRPITVALRQALHASVDVKTEGAKALINPCTYPATITADTLDWRPLTVRLRNQLAAAKLLPKLDGSEETNELFTCTAAVLLLLAVLVSWICLPGALAGVMTSLTVSVTVAGLVLPGKLLPIFAACVFVPGFHMLVIAGFLSFIAPPI